MAHRGAMMQAPENTAPALERCVEDGFEWMEIDLQLTKDGQHIICHNGSVDGVTNGTGRIKDMTVEELKQLDAGVKFAPEFEGTRLLTLREILTLAKGRVNLYLDCKSIDPARLVEDILATDMASQVVVFDDPDVLAKVHALSKGQIPTMPKWHPSYGKDEWVAQWQPVAVEINADEVTSDICTWFHQQGVKVQAKVLDEADTPVVWDRMLADGVDWLQTDLSEEILAHRYRQLPSRPIEISFHRGASRYAPENTLPSYEKAVRMGADYAELDVRTTRDGQFFLLHDDDLDRTTDGKGPIAEKSAAEIQSLHAGAWFGAPFKDVKVPSLEEAVNVMKGRIKLYVDAKDIAPDALARFLKENGVIEQSVVYQSPDYLIKLHESDPSIRALCPLGDATQVQSLHDTVHPYGFDTSWGILSKDLIDRCHALGIKVFSDSMWKHERIEDYQEAIDWGIDVIQTDYPLRVMRAVELRANRKN
jgi:glycerophosphoryl diester phosphodiesterase